MISDLLTLLNSFTIDMISTLGYTGIVLLMALESACTPFPSEVILFYSGYLVWTGDLNIWWVATMAALGCNCGSSIGYCMGAYGGRPFLLRYGKYLLLSRREIEITDRWFEQYGQWTVFFSRLLPMIRTFISFPAGVAGMNFWKFNLYTFMGSFLWCFALAYAGYKMGAYWTTLRVYFHRFGDVIGVFLAVMAAVYVWLYWKYRIREEA